MNILEKVLLVVFFTVSIYIFAAGAEFSAAVAKFPRAFAAMTLVGVVLIVLRSYYKSTEDQTDDEVDPPLEEATESSETENDNERSEESPLSVEQLLAICSLSFGYVLLGYGVGLFWATPLFILGYGKVFDLTKVKFAILLTVSMLILLLFMRMTNLQLMQGALMT